MNNNFSIPILFLIFNRPDITEKSFNIIKKIKPKKLYVSADGPRLHIKGETEKCKLTRDIINQIDWDCQVFTNFSEKNLGCKLGVVKGINWFFENEEEGIILEDDCLPNDTFFTFCKELLSYYKNDERVMHIGGTNFQDGIKRSDGGYYFSKFAHVWGWATWRRAWKYYDVSIKDFEEFKREDTIKNIWHEKELQKYWIKRFQDVYDSKIDTWDHQWTYAVWKENGVCIIPNENLVSNIGFGEDATHTKDSKSKLSMAETSILEEIIHPVFKTPNYDADLFTFKYKMRGTVIDKFMTKLRQFIK